MTDTKIRTLGLYQPFAALMAFGKIETRFVRQGRKPPFPLGKYLIYACRKGYSVLDGDLVNICTPAQADQIEELLMENDFLFCEFGSALMIGDLVSIIDPLTNVIESTFVDYIPPDEKERRVGLVFENMRRIKPFPFKGKQGIGFLSDEDKAKIEYL